VTFPEAGQYSIGVSAGEQVLAATSIRLATASQVPEQPNIGVPVSSHRPRGLADGSALPSARAR
jgi:hypothetical protein